MAHLLPGKEGSGRRYQLFPTGHTINKNINHWYIMRQIPDTAEGNMMI